MKAMPSYLRALLPVAALSFASLLKADTVRTLKADGSQNNSNIYSDRHDVWIGVQDGTSFTQDGVYFFGVTTPSSSSATSLLANDGAANTELPYTTQTTGNGNSAVTTPVAPQWSGNVGDPWGWLSRVMIVSGGKITGTLGNAHAAIDDPRNNGGKIVQLWPYAPSANNEYKIWMVHSSQVTVIYKIGAAGAVQSTDAMTYATGLLSNDPAFADAILLQATYPNSKGTSTDNFKVITQSANTLQLVCPSSQNLNVCPSAQGAYVTLGNASASGLSQGGNFVLDSIAFTNTNGGATVSVPQSNGQYFFPVGSTTVTISGHDSSAPSSTASCSFFIVVEATDVDAPVPNVANIDVSGQCSVTVTAPKATDNCAGQVTGTTSDPLTYTQQGIYIVHWTYSDGNGNTSTQNQTVTVKDDIKPVPTVASLPDVTGVCSVTLEAPTATDNCAGLITGTTGTMTFTGETDTVVTWSYNDGHGNIKTQTQHVVVHDGIAPTITAPSSFTVNTDAGNCSAIVTFDWSASDNCTLKSSSINIPSGSSFPKGATTVTINAEDAAGNKSSKSFTVTVVDNQAPVAPTLSSITGECSATALAPTATDNCDGTVTGIPDGPTTFNVAGTYTIVWTFTDAAGNSSTASQTVTVTDSTAKIAGVIFNDHNTGGSQDAGDLGLVNWTVTLKSGTTTVATTTTDASGAYSFAGLHSGTYTVVATINAGWLNTTPITSAPITVACGGTGAANFGCVTLGAGGALSKGFWTSKNGQTVFLANGPTTGTVNLAKLATYSLRDAKGVLVTLGNYSAVSSFLSGATATNMVNMLSAQLAAVVLDIDAGNQAAGAKYLLNCNGAKLVSVVNGTANSGSFATAALAAFPSGFATVDQVVAKAQALLAANSSADVATQTAVKNILDAICNNTNFVQ